MLVRTDDEREAALDDVRAELRERVGAILERTDTWALDLFGAEVRTACRRLAVRAVAAEPALLTGSDRDDGAAAAPVLRAVWCARAYRDFAGLYDVAITTVTQDRGKEALVSRLAMQGVSYDNALALAGRFIAQVAWAK